MERRPSSAALDAAREILERRGTSPREYCNAAVFAAVDHRRLEDLERGVAKLPAWDSVHREAGEDGLNLDPNQARQAKTKRGEWDRTVALRLADAFARHVYLTPASASRGGDAGGPNDVEAVERAAIGEIDNGLRYLPVGSSRPERRAPQLCLGYWSPGGIGALGRIRTCDTRLRRPLLYPLSYEGSTAGACSAPDPATAQPTWQAVS